MLSKSQAKLFFILFTSGFSLVFLWLTIDTIRAVPERSNQKQMTEEVVHGKQLWEQNNCMGCHTLLGEGAYYAPELTTVYARRGAVWIKTFIKDPQAMFPGERKMVQYDFNEEELDALVAFFEWIGKIDTNGFPAKPDMVMAPVATSVGDDPLKDAPEFYKQVCVACHAVGGQGGNVGPALDGVAARYSPEELDRWLADPQSVKPGTAMPNLHLADDVRERLGSWLLTLKK